MSQANLIVCFGRTAAPHSPPSRAPLQAHTPPCMPRFHHYSQKKLRFFGVRRMTAHDPNKHIASVSSRSFPHNPTRTGDVLPFLRRALLHLKGLWAALNPAARGANVEQGGEEAEVGEGEADSDVRLRVNALGTLAGILSTHDILHSTFPCANRCFYYSRCINARS